MLSQLCSEKTLASNPVVLRVRISVFSALVVMVNNWR